MDNEKKQMVINEESVANKHPDYEKFEAAWIKVRDCMKGEDVIKSKRTTYLPQPEGMSGDYESAYTSYIERAHFPLITSYALSGALGVIITKLPEFNVPSQLEYILESATKDGRSLKQLFIDIIIEIFQTGRVPILVDVLDEENEFRFVQYTAEELINWKTANVKSKKDLVLGVIREEAPQNDDIFSHDSEDIYRVLTVDSSGNYNSRMFDTDGEFIDLAKTAKFMGSTLDEIPLVIAGSINNSFDVQPIPLISVANCSVQIYRKEADLANSEFLSCNPTLVLVGASNEDDLPNVVGSSVMIVIPNEQARVFYTTTDTAALKHVKDHIDSLYEEAIRHGVSILDNRKGVESAEALRIRQATQSASVYSVYLAAMNALKQGLVLMCKWGGFNKEEVVLDAPASLTHGIPDPAVLREVVEGFGNGVVPLTVIHRYLVSSGLLDQTIGYEDYLELLDEEEKRRKKVNKNKGGGTDTGNDNEDSTETKDNELSTENKEEVEGSEDKL